MKKILALSLALILIMGAIFTIRFIKSPSYSEKTEFALNTVIKISAYGKDAEIAVDKALKEVHRIDALMSAHKASSEVYMLNSSNGMTVSKEVFDIIKTAKDIWQKTDGAFDITLKPLSDMWNIKAENPKIPDNAEIENALLKTGFQYIELNEENFSVSFKKEGMQIDLGGIAKGYAADRAAFILKENGIENALIDLGGNVYAIGKNRNKKHWKIGLQTPWEKRGEYYEVVEAKDTAVVTSGAYERYFEKDGKIYHHILNPKTGYPQESEFQSVTVIHKNSALADALSTAIFVSGEKGALKAKAEFKDIKIIVVTKTSEVKQY